MEVVIPYFGSYKTAELVKKHRGSLSGEHGDGHFIGEFIPFIIGR